MYQPAQDGIDKLVKNVQVAEIKPPKHLNKIVHHFWQIKSLEPLEHDFEMLALPDACVNILFNQINLEIAGVTALHTEYRALNLGRHFHYVGIQFFPGMWFGDLKQTQDHFVGDAYEGALPLLKTNHLLFKKSFEDMTLSLTELTDALIRQKIVGLNPLTSCLMAHVDELHNVEDMAKCANISPRQLQRRIKTDTGFSPRDFLKVMRLQNSFRYHYLDYYADQSHYIHQFKQITGHTPKAYFDKFDV